jgi:hypothetical protein
MADFKTGRNRMKRPGRHSRVNPLFTSTVRVTAGFLFAPILGLILYYVPSFIIAFPEISSSNAFSLGIAATLVGGTVFYPPAVLISVVVMLLIRRFYQWNLISSIIGAMIIGLFIVLISAVVFWVATSEFMLAQVGFFRLFSLFAGPSVFSGIVFWLLAVYRNFDLHPQVET